MNIFRTTALRAHALSLILPLVALAIAGCDVGSTDSTTAVLSDNSGTIYNFAGLYAHATTNGLAPLVFPTNRQSGVALTWLRLLQYGSVLEAYDNAGMTWSGSISALQGGTATFSLRGRTTAGISTEIAGTLVYADQNSVMDASWIEPAFAGTLYARATVAPATTNSPTTDDVSISPSSATLSPNGDSEDFSASGGTGSYSWSLSGGIGTLSSASGSSTMVTRTNSGFGTLIVTSGTDTDSITISCP